MSFLPIDLPIQEILLTNFVTDIATISNANDLILKDKIEDLINNLEIDINAQSIGTDNPINYVRTQSVIIQESGLIFQTGNPVQIIARLEKNSVNESILTVDRLNANIALDADGITVNSLLINTAFVSDGTALFNDTIEFKSSLIESKETLILPLENMGTSADARITLTSASRKNIFVKLSAVTAPNLNFAYDGAGNWAAGIVNINIFIDFDATNPPAQNTTFTIHLVDIIENISSTSILPPVTPVIPVLFKGGQNLNATPVAQIYLHNNLGIFPNSNIGINPASSVVGNNTPSYYGHNLSLLYILDENTDDRLMITGAVGMEIF